MGINILPHQRKRKSVRDADREGEKFSFLINAFIVHLVPTNNRKLTI